MVQKMISSKDACNPACLPCVHCIDGVCVLTGAVPAESCRYLEPRGGKDKTK